MKKRTLFLLFLLVGYSHFLRAQYVEEVESQESVVDSSQTVLVELKNGNEVLGVIISENGKEITIQTESFGKVIIPWKDISSITTVDESQAPKKGGYYSYNLQSTRYFYGPNGYGLRKGEGYYQNVWIFFNQASYGFTDYFSMGVGTVPLNLITGDATPVWIAPKFSIPIKKDMINVGIGFLGGTAIRESVGGFGIGYGTITIGNRNHNFSISLGFAGVSEEDISEPVISISGMTRVTRRTYLLTENYFFPETQIISFGGRTFAGRVGIDYGLFWPFGARFYVGIPWVGVNVPFGNYK